MPTEKRRLNLSLTKEAGIALKQLAKRDQVPEATKALDLLVRALEIDEDDVWNAVCEKRDTTKAKFVSHKDAWL